MADYSRFDALANAPFAENCPMSEAARALRDELLFQRATQAYLWALPLISTLGMKVGSEAVFGAFLSIRRKVPRRRRTHSLSSQTERNRSWLS
jgi:hypothetical protein